MAIEDWISGEEPPGTTFFQCAGRIIRETKKAVLFKQGGYEVWLPKSRIQVFKPEKHQRLTRVVVPDWLYAEKEMKCESCWDEEFV